MESMNDELLAKLKVTLSDWLEAPQGWAMTRASDAVCRAAMRYCNSMQSRQGTKPEVVANGL